MTTEDSNTDMNYTAPTVDDIKGTTVFVKLRNLIDKFVEFANNIVNRQKTVESKVDGVVDTAQGIVDGAVDTINSTVSAGKTEIDAKVSDSKTEIDNALQNIENSVAQATTAANNAQTYMGTAQNAASNAQSASATAQTYAGNSASEATKAASSEANADAYAKAAAQSVTDASTVLASAIKNKADSVQTIDSDLQITNGHDLAVANDLSVGNDVTVINQITADSAEIGNVAIEKSNNKTVISNSRGISINSLNIINGYTYNSTYIETQNTSKDIIFAKVPKDISKLTLSLDIKGRSINGKLLLKEITPAYSFDAFVEDLLIPYIKVYTKADDDYYYLGWYVNNHTSFIISGNAFIYAGAADVNTYLLDNFIEDLSDYILYNTITTNISYNSLYFSEPKIGYKSTGNSFFVKSNNSYLFIGAVLYNANYNARFFEIKTFNTNSVSKFIWDTSTNKIFKCYSSNEDELVVVKHVSTSHKGIGVSELYLKPKVANVATLISFDLYEFDRTTLAKNDNTNYYNTSNKVFNIITRDTTFFDEYSLSTFGYNNNFNTRIINIGKTSIGIDTLPENNSKTVND